MAVTGAGEEAVSEDFSVTVLPDDIQCNRLYTYTLFRVNRAIYEPCRVGRSFQREHKSLPGA